MRHVNSNGSKLEIIEIYPDNLFAVKFDDKDQNEYEAAFDLWQDLDYLVEFFNDNKDLINTDFWREALPSLDSEDLAQSIIDESFDLLDYIKKIATNTSKGKSPDFDAFFQELGGKKYSHLREYVPQKSYGTSTPTMLRLYAIRLDSNCYIVVHGGIKLTHEIQGTPLLNKELFPKIDNVLQFFRANGIIDTEDLIG